MATGTVKWFNDDKGYGFIEVEGGGKDAFVHVNGLAPGTRIAEGRWQKTETTPAQAPGSIGKSLRSACRV